MLRFSSVVLGLALVLGSTVAMNTPTTRVDSDQPASLPSQAVDPSLQPADEALNQDLAAVADARGWSDSEATSYNRAEHGVGRLAETVAERWPEAFVGSALSPEPGGAPTLYIKGPADEGIRALVEASAVKIILADLQPFSLAELEARKILVHRELEALGFRQVVTGFSLGDAGLIKAAVTRERGHLTDSEAVVASLSADIRASVDLTIRDIPIVEPEGAFGGMLTNSAAGPECTSGWTVIQLNTGTRGVSSAGHCIGVININHPGHALHPTTWKNGVEGQWGDVEWYTTAQAEADDFYSEAAVIRDVGAIEPAAGISENEAICVYGRASPTRDCSLSVLNVSIACGNLNRLVQMNGDTQVGGDSGGPWYFGTTAFGGHFGNCGGLDSFSKASFFDEALGISVATS